MLYKEPDRVVISGYPTLCSDKRWVLREGVGERKCAETLGNLTLYIPQSLVICDLMIIVEKCFSVVILEVSHVFAVSKNGVTVLLLSLISLCLPSGNHL